jgi:hypothetical protein
LARGEEERGAEGTVMGKLPAVLPLLLPAVAVVG